MHKLRTQNNITKNEPAHTQHTMTKTVQMLRAASSVLGCDTQSLDDASFMEALAAQYPQSEILDMHFTAQASRLGGHLDLNDRIMAIYGLPLKRPGQSRTSSPTQSSLQNAEADIVGILTVLAAIKRIGGSSDIQVMEEWIVKCMQAAGERSELPGWMVLHRDVCAPGALSMYLVSRRQ
jgi:hypothetical protein